MEWILTLILKCLTVTVTTFTQCGPEEDHSWRNEVPILCDIFNLNQNSTYEAATAIAVLGNSYIHLVFQSNEILLSKYIHPHVYVQYQNSPSP